MAKQCLYCYEPLEDAGDYHPHCSKAFFGTDQPPLLDYSLDDMEKLAKEIVVLSIAVTGVQAKLSLDIELPKKGGPKESRFTLVGLWGNFILKPPVSLFNSLPENEDLTMHLAELTGLSAAPHSLIRLRSGELAYITRRFDRRGGTKVPMEDMCQLTETLTENKYRSSMEKIGKQLLKLSSAPGLDALRLFSLSVFCFITGNADMHLKNFSLVTSTEGDITLSPAYDLVNTKIAMPKDQEEMALALNGKRAKIKRSDFDLFAKNLKLPPKAVQRVFDEMENALQPMLAMIDRSFLPTALKEAYRAIMLERIKQIELRLP